LLKDDSNDFPGLAASDWLHETVILGIEKDEMGMITSNFRIGSQILFEGFLDPGIDHDFLTFAPLLLLDPKLSLDMLIVIQEMLNL
jgi:hypothetical protein